MVTTKAPDLPDWAAGQQAVTVPTFLGTVLVNSDSTYTAQIDVSAYSAVFLEIVEGNTDGVFAVFSNDSPGPPTIATGSSAAVFESALLSVMGRFLQFTGLDVTAQNVKVWGYGRVSPDPRVIVAGHAAEPYVATLPSTAMVAGTSYSLNAALGSQLFQGPAFMMASISGTTAGGLVEAVTWLGTQQWLCDTKEMLTLANGNRGIFRACAIPANVVGLTFGCTVSGTGVIRVQLTPNY